MLEMIVFFQELAEHEAGTGDPDFATQIENFVEKMEDEEIRTMEEAAQYFYDLYNSWKG